VIQAQAAALDAIVTHGRGALGEMRLLFDLDSSTDREIDRRAPLPGLAELPELVDRIRAAGLPVTLAIQPAGPVPAHVGLSAYRIVQESLTNTLKHAGPGAHAEVSIRCAPRDVQISVADTGGTTATLSGSATQGRGLRGMRERVSMFGGELRAGAGPHGGFHVYARLPFEAHP
jgi:signal transduction histidine kinase